MSNLNHLKIPKIGHKEVEVLLLLAIMKKEKPLRNQEVADFIEDSEANTWTRLRRLLNHGLVRKNADKTYEITTTGLEQIVKRILK